MTVALELSDVCLSYKKSTAPILNGVDLQLPTEHLLAVLGPSGCGKTTTLKVMAGLLRADQGTMLLNGKEVFSNSSFVPPERRRIGLVPQDAALFPHLTVAQNVAFGLQKHPAKKQRVADMLDLVDAQALAKRKPAELSGGQAQRIALARALAPAPDVILLDEPFAALDAALRLRLRTDIRGILQEAGASAILVTHDQDEALSMADHIAVMHHGKVIQHGKPQQVYDEPINEWIAHFLGTCCILDDGRVVRPEHITLKDPAERPNAQTGTVISVDYLGHSTVYQIRAFGTELSARQLGAPSWQVGAKVSVDVADNVHRVNVEKQGG